MKKGMLMLVFVLSILTIGFVSASCDLEANLLNQDPYPATPGEYVKVVFQINGSETTDCGQVFLDVVPEYPFSIENNATQLVVLGGNYLTDYNSYILKGYKLRVDENALDGDNPLKIAYGYKGGSSMGSYTKDFNVNVKDARTDFEVSVQSYDAAKGSVTFGIINIGKYNAESLALEIPQQDNIAPKGSNVAIIGSLNSNDDTTASIEAVPKAGEITVKLNYNDQNDVRRTVEKKVYFTSNFIENSVVQTTRDKFFYMFWMLLIIVIIWMVYGYYKRKKAKNNRLNQLRR